MNAERHPEKRALGQESDQPQAGHRHRPVRSPGRRQKICKKKDQRRNGSSFTSILTRPWIDAGMAVARHHQALAVQRLAAAFGGDEGRGLAVIRIDLAEGQRRRAVAVIAREQQGMGQIGVAGIAEIGRSLFSSAASGTPLQSSGTGPWLLIWVAVTWLDGMALSSASQRRSGWATNPVRTSGVRRSKGSRQRDRRAKAAARANFFIPSPSAWAGAGRRGAGVRWLGAGAAAAAALRDLASRDVFPAGIHSTCGHHFLLQRRCGRQTRRFEIPKQNAPAVRPGRLALVPHVSSGSA